MGFTSYRCTIPRTSEQRKVLGNAEFAPLRLRQNNFFPHAVTRAWILFQNSLVLVSPKQRRRVWLTWSCLWRRCPLASLSLWCPTAGCDTDLDGWDSAGCFPLGFLAGLPEHFSPWLLILPPCPIQGWLLWQLGEQKGLRQDSVTSGTPAVHQDWLLGDRPAFLPYGILTVIFATFGQVHGFNVHF